VKGKPKQSNEKEKESKTMLALQNYMLPKASPSTASHPMFPLALHLSSLPSQNNPLINPSARLPAGVSSVALKAVAQHPELAAIGTGAMAPPASGGGAASDANMGSGAFNPSVFKRLPATRHLVCGAALLALGAAGSGTLKFSPQIRFKGNHLIIPSNMTAGTISNMLVGAFPQFAAQGAEDFAEFREDSTGGMWDLDPCDPGQTISCSATSVAAQTVTAAIVGEAADQKSYTPLRSALKRVGIPSTAVGAGATVTIPIAPQVGFKPRKLVLTLANVTGLIINSWLIGINPVFVSGDPVPAVAMSEFAQELWFDLDEAHIGNQIAFQVNNPTAGGLTFSGGLLGDVNPADAARVAQR